MGNFGLYKNQLYSILNVIKSSIGKSATANYTTYSLQFTRNDILPQIHKVISGLEISQRLSYPINRERFAGLNFRKFSRFLRVQQKFSHEHLAIVKK